MLTLIQFCVITFTCSFIPRIIFSIIKVIEMFSKINNDDFSKEGSSFIVKEICKQEVVLILLPVICLALVSQLIQLEPKYYAELGNGIKIITMMCFGSWILLELYFTTKLSQKISTVTTPKNLILSTAEPLITAAIKTGFFVIGGPKKAALKLAKRGVVSLTKDKISELDESNPSKKTHIALKTVNAVETIVTLPEKLIGKGMETFKNVQESKAKKLEAYPTRSVKTSLLLICWSILPVAYIVLLSYAL